MSVESVQAERPSYTKQEAPTEVSSPPDALRDSPSSSEGNVQRESGRTLSAGEEEESFIDKKSNRVPLACFYCRSKKIRCSGTRPVCQVCKEGSIDCEWPSGRRRKRTRKEMEEAKELENAQEDMHIEPEPASMSSLGGGMLSSTPGALADSSMDWTFPSTNFLWPTNLASDDAFIHQPSPVDQDFFAAFPASSMTFPSMQMTMGDPATMKGMPDPRMIDALQKQTAFIEGDLGDQDLELFYYRFSGPTAMHPGINRISLKLQRRNETSTPITAPNTESTLPPPKPISIEMFDNSGMPYSHISQPLFDLFFINLSQHFPSISRQRMQERFDSGTMSSFLANCICALGARFAEDARADPARACAPFIEKAQELIPPLLHLPTNDVATGLLLLAWASFGQNSESGMWQYSGMAIRMAIDLGILEVSEIYESPAHMIRTRLFFWSLFITDRIVAFSTGRPASIPEESIEIALPRDEDLFPDPSRNIPGAPDEPIEPVPFVQLTRLMVIVGRISNVLNGPRGRARTLVSTNEPHAERLKELQVKLVQFLGELPPSMQWTADNFKHQAARGHGGTFLALHLWSNAVLSLIYHPELLHVPSGIETPLNQSMNRSLRLAVASARQVSECMVFADLVSNTSYTSTPYATQPLYVAAMALIHEMRTSQTSAADGKDPNSYSADVFFLSMARQNFSALLNALRMMTRYWSGAITATNLLEKRSGFLQPPSGSMTKTFISLPDKGLLRRFATDRDHPHNVAPATETSLRESIAKTELSASSPYWLADLMNSYRVENTTFSAAGSPDIERLLAAGNAIGDLPAPSV